ncbi:hypothetical protein TELCIR_15500, partial [Teladorsagia circumcincta]
LSDLFRCDLPGCQFTTREARYIHFHKYYRHGIALPDSIDQGAESTVNLAQHPSSIQYRFRITKMPSLSTCIEKPCNVGETHKKASDCGNENAYTCEVDFKIKTNKERAAELCEAVSPYPILSVKEGYPTKCVYGWSHYCTLKVQSGGV